MLPWAALDIDPARLGLELVLVHTKNWCKLEMLPRSWEERNLVVVSVGLGILVELRVHPVKEECVVPKQPPRPWVPF